MCIFIHKRMLQAHLDEFSNLDIYIFIVEVLKRKSRQNIHRKLMGTNATFKSSQIVLSL